MGKPRVWETGRWEETYKTTDYDRGLVVPKRSDLTPHGLDDDEAAEHAHEGPEYDDDVAQALLVLLPVPEEVRDGPRHVLPWHRRQPRVHIVVDVEIPRCRGDRDGHVGGGFGCECLIRNRLTGVSFD